MQGVQKRQYQWLEIFAFSCFPCQRQVSETDTKINADASKSLKLENYMRSFLHQFSCDLTEIFFFYLRKNKVNWNVLEILVDSLKQKK